MIKGLLGTGMDDPRTRANLAMAMGLLEAGGPSLRPTSLGQTIGRAGAMGVQAYDAALKAQQAKKLEDLQFKTAEANLAKLGTEAAEARRRSQIMGQIAIAKPSALPSLYAQLDPTAAAKAAFERSGKPPETKQIYDPTSRTMRLRAFNPATQKYDIDYGPAGAPEKPQTITSGGVTGTMGQDVFGRATFIPLPGAPVTPQKPTFVQTGVEGTPGATQQNISVADPTAPGGFRLMSIGDPKLPRLTQGMQITTSPTGETTITTGVTDGTGALQKGVIKDQQTAIAEIDATLATLDQAAANFQPEFLTTPGRWKNITTNIASKMGFEPSIEDVEAAMEYNQFMASAAQTFSEQLLRLSGAAVSQGEYARAKAWIPFAGTANNPFGGDSPIQYDVKLRNMTGTLTAAKFRSEKILKENKITAADAKTYPISIKRGRKTLYIHEYVNSLVGQGVDEATAIDMWSKEPRS